MIKLAKKKIKITKKKIFDTFVDYLFYILGGISYSISVNMFSTPNHISIGGLTGISTLLNYLFQLPVGVMVFVMNIPLYILSFKILGTKFLARTIVATASCSIFIDLLEKWIPPYTNNPLLAAIFCGVTCGLALSLVFMRGATTGGTDIIAKLVHKFRPNISLGKVLLLCDAIVVGISGLVYKNLESMLYASITIFVASKTIDFIIYGSAGGKLLLIVTSKVDEMTEAITERLDRGATIIPAKGGYTREDKDMILCAVRSHEIANINKIVKEIDPNAFTMITNASEIVGEGFQSEIS